MGKYKQMQMILEPTAIEDLLNQDADYDMLADAMLINWETFGHLHRDDESWSILRELPSEFIFDNVLNDHDSYKGVDYRSLIIKIRNRFFSYDYSTSIYDDDCWDWDEVYPIGIIHYEVKYVSKDSVKSDEKNILVDKQYQELFKENSSNYDMKFKVSNE